jgi:hypothetical protein
MGLLYLYFESGLYQEQSKIKEGMLLMFVPVLKCLCRDVPLRNNYVMANAVQVVTVCVQ